jgi:hypothetical protein
VVECAALEMRFTGNGNVGSNPTLSATALIKSTPYKGMASQPTFAPAFRLALGPQSNEPPTPIRFLTGTAPTPGTPPDSG